MKNNTRLFPYALTILAAMVGMIIAADEITVTGLLKVDNGSFNLTRTVQNLRITQTGTSMDYHIQSIATGTAEQITIIADVSTNGYTWMRNISTNTDRVVQIGVTNGGTFAPVIQLEANDFALYRLTPSVNLYALSVGGGAVNLETWVNED